MSNEQLIKRIRAGEARQLEALIEQNQGLIYRTAKRYIGHAAQNRALDIDDLYQSAVLGLLEAVPTWDESRGAFTTLAVMHMKNSVRAALGIHTAKQRIENMPTASLDAPIAEGEDIALIDTLADDMAIDPADAAIEADTCRLVRDAVNSLPDEQRREIEAVYFMGGTQTDRQTIDKARQALRKKLRRLWAEYETAPHFHQGFKSWKYTHTSSTEAAVLRRDELLLKVTALLQAP